MAQENVGININVQGNAVESIGNVKKALREANAELIAAQANFGDYSDEAIAAAKRVAELKDRISEARETADLFDPGKKFQAFAGAINAVAGGFTAVQGALGLIGVESEEVEKSLLKVQSALALSQGLNAITDSAKDFQRLATTLKKDVVSAFNAVKAAIGATGIGVLLLALGAIVTFWDDIKAAVTGVSEEQKKLTEETNKNAKAQQEKLSAIDSQENILKLQGKSEREILSIKIKQTDEVIKATEQQIAQQKVVVKAQLEAEKRNKEILQGIIRFLFAPLSLILSTVDQVGKVLGKDFNLEEKFSGGIAGLVFNPEETEKKGKETLAALDKSLNDLKNKRAGYQLSIQAIDKQAADQAAEAEAARYQKILDDEKKLTEDLFAEYEKRRGIAVKAKILTQKELAALDEQERLKKKEADDKAINEQIALLSKAKNYTLQLIKDNQEANAKIKADNDAAREAELTARMAFAASVAMAIGELNGLFEQGTAASKIAGLAQIAINTGVGFAQGLSIAQQSAKATGPAAAFAFPIFYATQVAAVLAAAGKAKSILSQVKGGGSGGSVTAPSIQQQAPISPATPQAATTNISAQSINALGNQAIRTYVIESDVTSNQQRIAAIQQRARFG